MSQSMRRVVVVVLDGLRRDDVVLGAQHLRIDSGNGFCALNRNDSTEQAVLRFFEDMYRGKSQLLAFWGDCASRRADVPRSSAPRLINSIPSKQRAICRYWRRLFVVAMSVSLVTRCSAASKSPFMMATRQAAARRASQSVNLLFAADASRRPASICAAAVSTRPSSHNAIASKFRVSRWVSNSVPG